MEFISFVNEDPSSSKIFRFLALTLSFMVLEMVYGHLSGSLSLMSDGIHMLCDSTALLIGLLVSFISKSKSQSFKYPFGLVKIEPLFGLINGLFLVFVSISLFNKSVHKLRNPIQNTDQYEGESIIVAIGGLIVNLMGLVCFHEDTDKNENIYGLFLHVLADTLGSIGVIVSTYLAKRGYLFADPACAMLVSIMIFVSVVPLIKMSCCSLLLENTKEA